ncbi:MAG: PhoH family protein [Bifidobacteriaceae bacterium]|nr:PhoH family protein [Bifidobacteriaceae bacterium]
MGTATRNVVLPSDVSPVDVFGPGDSILHTIEKKYPNLTFVARGDEVRIVSGSARDEVDARQAQDVLKQLVAASARQALAPRSVRMRRPFDVAFRKEKHKVGERYARPRTAGQAAYVDAIAHSTITFGIGPAGTGKTYLAVAQAVTALEEGQVQRIVLTRPVVEAGESLGFLPGTVSEKIDPYLQPLYDALSTLLGFQRLRKELDDHVIEVAPLAYMRGRTLDGSFVILDEAQNTTVQQMKMFLTRLGAGTTMVVTGDATQIDLGPRRSGLTSIEGILQGIPDISFVHLGAKDVVRNELVGQIVEAYARHDAAQSVPDSVKEKGQRTGTGLRDASARRGAKHER